MTKILKKAISNAAEDLLLSVGLQRRRRNMDYMMPAMQWMLVGAVVGGVAALLLAPSTGEDLRGQLGERLQSAREKAREAAANMRPPRRANGSRGESARSST